MFKQNASSAIKVSIKDKGLFFYIEKKRGKIDSTIEIKALLKIQVQYHNCAIFYELLFFKALTPHSLQCF